MTISLRDYFKFWLSIYRWLWAKRTPILGQANCLWVIYGNLLVVLLLFKCNKTNRALVRQQPPRSKWNTLLATMASIRTQSISILPKKIHSSIPLVVCSWLRTCTISTDKSSSAVTIWRSQLSRFQSLESCSRPASLEPNSNARPKPPSSCGTMRPANRSLFSRAWWTA